MKSEDSTAKCVMVLGTTSGAGKSLVATALCRWLSNHHVRVAPFKSFNMSNYSRVADHAAVDGGVPSLLLGEIAAAQFFQAMACRTRPTTLMNPILFKPERSSCEVVILGQVSKECVGFPWHQWNAKLWPHAQFALRELRNSNKHDVIVIEGMGSPAEINLNDFANIETAREADAACLLVVDLDKGGAFAHLLGTYELLAPADRRRIKGFVINKSRCADRAVLQKGIDELQRRTGVPTVAVIPLLPRGIPYEDAAALGGQDDDDDVPPFPEGSAVVAIVAYPFMSNADEFEALAAVIRRRQGKGAVGRIRWVRAAAELRGARLIILPGSKDTLADLQWLSSTGVGAAIREMSSVTLVIGICGGLQMLGTFVSEKGVTERGLGLLQQETVIDDVSPETPKQISRTNAVVKKGVTGPWSSLFESLHRVSGYEIHRGRAVDDVDGAETEAVMWSEIEQGKAVGWQRGHVLGTYLHGLFEDKAFCKGVLNGIAGDCGDANLLDDDDDDLYDELADAVERYFDPHFLTLLLGI